MNSPADVKPRDEDVAPVKPKRARIDGFDVAYFAVPVALVIGVGWALYEFLVKPAWGFFFGPIFAFLGECITWFWGLLVAFAQAVEWMLDTFGLVGILILAGCALIPLWLVIAGALPAASCRHCGSSANPGYRVCSSCGRIKR